MKIVLAYTHHRRTLNWYYKRALQRLGHEVFSVGPWNESMTFGTYGREPDVTLPDKYPVWYDYAELRVPWTPDLVWILEGGEDLRIHNVPYPLVHQSVEGSNMEWSKTVTPHRYVNFTCNGATPPDVTFLPYGFDREHVGTKTGNIPIVEREYDCVQVGSARQSRTDVWRALRDTSDLNTWFSGDLWGPAHFSLYRNGRSTFVNQTKDFMCPRVFDAMAMGCVLISDRVPVIMNLFEDGKHFLGYDRVMCADGEGVPPIEWLRETIHRCRRDPAWAQAISTAAYNEAWNYHTYEHRVGKVLDDVRRA